MNEDEIKGLVYIFTGDGKGKTSAALGMVVRAICAGLKAAWVSWYKDKTWPISEKKLPRFLEIDMHFLGKGFYISKKSPALKREHKEAALAGLRKANQILKAGQHDLLVCDEINSLVKDGLLTVGEIKEVVEARGKTHLIMTGRNAPKEIIKLADLVTEMKKIKHPYDQAKLAVKGLDY